MSRPRAAVLAIACAAAGCGDRPPSGCAADLGGIYVDAADRARWIVVDRGDTVEIYPAFADVPPVGDLEVAPRVIDLTRERDRLAGYVRRRYLRGAEICHARAPARITACKARGIEVVMADPVPPIAFAPCVFGTPNSSRVVRWSRD